MSSPLREVPAQQGRLLERQQQITYLDLLACPTMLLRTPARAAALELLTLLHAVPLLLDGWGGRGCLLHISESVQVGAISGVNEADGKP
jgi:hypothetical protein